MFIVYIVVAIINAVLLVSSGTAKLQHNKILVHGLNEVLGVPLRFFPWLATAEYAATLGLLVGIAWGPIGIAAAIGQIIYFIGAIVTHLRAKDYKVGTPLLLLVIGAVLLVLRILTIAQEPFHF